MSHEIVKKCVNFKENVELTINIYIIYGFKYKGVGYSNILSNNEVKHINKKNNCRSNSSCFFIRGNVVLGHWIDLKAFLISLSILVKSITS